LPSASASPPRLWNLAERRTDDDVTRDGGGERARGVGRRDAGADDAMRDEEGERGEK